VKKVLEKGAYNSTSTRVKQDGNVPTVRGEFFFFIRFLRKELIDGIALLTASNPSFREGSKSCFESSKE